FYYKFISMCFCLLVVIYGLALQMLSYLDVVLTQSEQWLGEQASPAGMLYFHVHNAMLSDQQKPSEDDIGEALFKKYKMNGLLLSDEDIVRMMDTSLTSGSSSIVPAGMKKNGG